MWRSSTTTNYSELPAGASDRAGLIDVPDINAKKNMSRPTIPPMSIPLYPLNPLEYTTITIKAINKANANTSIPNIVGSGKT